MIQLVSQLLPASNEKDCSHRAELGESFRHKKRTLIGLPS